MKPRHLDRHFIKEWRLARGYSLRRLAGMMEREPGEQLTSHSNLDRIEKRLQPYNQEILEALAVALQCAPADLLTVDPSKDGEVVVLLALIRKKDKATVEAILKGLPDAATDTTLGPID